MVKRFLLIAGLLFSIQANAQTGIGTTMPHASAKLEISASNKGFLPPRVSLTGTTDVSTIASPATGLVIYNTATAGTTPNNVLPGYYYYYDGTKWNGLVDQSSLNSFSGFNPNYAQSNASAVTKNTIGDIIVSQSITTSGRPVQIIATGDANPGQNGAWVQLQLFRDNTAIGKKIQAESSLVNENVPYCLNFIDNPTTPGTYTYSVRIVNGGAGGFGFGEADGNHITLLELGAWSAGTMPVSKGGTGNSSYTAGSVMFSDGTNIAQNNTQLFWDNTNRRLGIGNNAPSTNLDVTGSLGISGSAIFRAAGGDEGGEIEFGVPQTNTNLSTRVVTDIWQNRYRIFDGNSKGVYIDLNKAPAGVGGEITFKASGYVNAGSFVQLDNIKATVPTSGNRSLSLATVSGTFTSYVTGVYAQVGGGSAGTGSYVTVTTTPSLPISWNFGGAGDTVTYMINDTTNSKVYRIVLMIGPGYNNNFISIERLH